MTTGGAAWREGSDVPDGPVPAGIVQRRRAELSSAISLLLLIAALWLATRPYYGIVQDARFYVLPALRLLHPAAFADDLYFRFGATDRFTIFARLCAPFLAVFGVGTGAMLCTIAGQLLWVGGLFYLALGWLRDRWVALLSVAVVVALPAGYSHYGYGEPFVTPRLFAEALTLWALGCLLRGYRARCLGLLVLSSAMHPIMTLAGIGVALIYLALKRPVWWLAIAAGAVAAVALALAGVPPFANLRAAFDPAWFEIARLRNSEALTTTWSVEHFCWVVPTIALACLGVAMGESRERRLFAAAMAVGIGALACTFIGADLARNVFILQMMPWRSMWLPAVLTHLYLVPILLWLRNRRDIDDLTKTALLTALGCLLLSRLIPPLVLAAAPMTTLAAALVIWQSRTGRPLSRGARLVCCAALGATGAVTLLFAGQFVVTLGSLPGELRDRLASFSLVVAALGLAAAQASTMGSESLGRYRSLPWISAALLAVALLGWDVRTPWTRLVERPRGAAAQLEAVLPRTASVYWEGGVEMLWFGLRRPSYFSCAQGTGAMFFRDAAIEFRRRADSFRLLATSDFSEPDCKGFAPNTPSPRTGEALRQVCRREPGLDTLVLIREVPGVAAAVWRSPAPLRSIVFREGRATAEDTDRFYVYSCAGLR